MENTNQESNAKMPCCHHHKNPVKIIVAGLFGILIIVTAVFMVFAAMNEYKKSSYIGQDIVAKNTVSITGEGKIYAAPDIGLIDLGVISQASTVASAQKDNVQKMNKITQAMKDLGVDEKDMKTTAYNISPRYQYNNYYSRNDIIGYEVSQTLEVKIRNLDKVGDIIAKAAELGANQTGSLSFTFDDPEKTNAEARTKAIANAKAKADTLAASLGVKLVRIISFSESSYTPPTPYYSEKALGVGGGASTPDIQTGQNEVTSNVTIVYEIQ